MNQEQRKLFQSTKLTLKFKMSFKRISKFLRTNLIDVFSLACVRPMHSSKRLENIWLKLIELKIYRRKILIIQEVRSLLFFENQTVMSTLQHAIERGALEENIKNYNTEIGKKEAAIRIR